MSTRCYNKRSSRNISSRHSNSRRCSSASLLPKPCLRRADPANRRQQLSRSQSQSTIPKTTRLYRQVPVTIPTSSFSMTKPTSTIISKNSSLQTRHSSSIIRQLAEFPIHISSSNNSRAPREADRVQVFLAMAASPTSAPEAYCSINRLPRATKRIQVTRQEPQTIRTQTTQTMEAATQCRISNCSPTSKFSPQKCMPAAAMEAFIHLSSSSKCMHTHRTLQAKFTITTA